MVAATSASTPSDIGPSAIGGIREDWWVGRSIVRMCSVGASGFTVPSAGLCIVARWFSKDSIEAR